MTKPSAALAKARSDIIDLNIALHDRDEQMERLARFIASHVPGELSGEGAIDTAIRLIGESAKIENSLSFQRGRADSLIDERDRAQAAAREAAKLRDEVLEENTTLRHQLHAAELGMARLEGQLERVREFDPVPERQRYDDSLPTRREHGSGSVASGMNSYRPRAWFEREAR